MALRVSIGQYYTADSPLHRIDPRAKLVATIIFMVSCLMVQSPATLAVALITVGAAAAASRVPAGRLLAQVRPLAIFLAVTSLINLFFIQTGDIVATLGPIALHAGGVEAAVLYTVRFFLLLVAGSLLMLTTTPVELTDALAWLLRPLERLGASAGETALIISIALGLVPALSLEARDIVAAQTARGADLEDKGPIAYARACVPLLVPLFTSALRHAENLGRAMEARCYTGSAGRTHYHELRFKPRCDLPFILLVAAYLVALAVFFTLGI